MTQKKEIYGEQILWKAFSPGYYGSNSEDTSTLLNFSDPHSSQGWLIRLSRGNYNPFVRTFQVNIVANHNSGEPASALAFRLIHKAYRLQIGG